MHLRSAAGRALSKTARNSQVLCRFRRRMPIENPASLRRTTDTWLIFCCKKQQKQPERGSAPKNEIRCRKAKSRSSACAGWRASAAPAITASCQTSAPRQHDTAARDTIQRLVLANGRYRRGYRYITQQLPTRSAASWQRGIDASGPSRPLSPGRTGLKDRRVSRCRRG